MVDAWAQGVTQYLGAENNPLIKYISLHAN